ncbi:FAD/NAD-P-binding domain-containing protein [Lactarius hengduanensis]|nr:FAD/NAD-P-binding domain-containing protein [Lactarius hengduanensis]
MTTLRGDSEAPNRPESQHSARTSSIRSPKTRLREFAGEDPPTIPHPLPISLSSLKSHYTPSCLPTHPLRRVPPPLHETEHVSIIGQGHIALDVVRMLLTPPTVLAEYDVPVPVLDVFRRFAVPPLDGTPMLPLAPELFCSPTSDAKLTRQQSRLLQLQQQRVSPEPGPSRTKTWSLDFFRSPTSLSTAPGSQQLALTRVTSVQHTDLVVTALGHNADPAAAHVDPGLGYLRTGCGGWVLDAEGRSLRRVYASGWAATGARGTLALTILDAYGVTDSILADYDYDADAENSEDALVADDTVDLESVPVEVEEGVRARRILQYDQWKKIDAEEVRCGAEMDKERERMGWEEAHDFLTSTGTWQSQ